MPTEIRFDSLINRVADACDTALDVILDHPALMFTLCFLSGLAFGYLS